MEPEGFLGLTLDHIMSLLTRIDILKTYLNGLSTYISIFRASFHVFPSGLFFSGFLTKILSLFLITIKCALCSVSHVLTVTMCG